jgi:hypothetical protein
MVYVHPLNISTPLLLRPCDTTTVRAKMLLWVPAYRLLLDSVGQARLESIEPHMDHERV